MKKPSTAQIETATALKKALSRRDRDAVVHLLEAGASPDGLPGHEPPLFALARRGEVGLMEVLLAAGANVDALFFQNETALHVAAAQLQAGAVACLLAHGADVNAVDGQVRPPLLVAAFHAYIHRNNPDDKRGENVARLLFEAGADVHFTTYGTTVTTFDVLAKWLELQMQVKAEQTNRLLTELTPAATGPDRPGKIM